MQGRRVLLVATSFVLALAVWVSRGALAVSDAASWPHRIGILPSRWAPPVLALILLIALRRAHRSTLLVLLVPGILLLPWLPFPVPSAALIWTGHAMTWVWMATALAVAAVEWPRWSRTRIAHALNGPGIGSITALVLAFVVYCSAAWFLPAGIPGSSELRAVVLAHGPQAAPIPAPGWAALTAAVSPVAGHRGVVGFLALVSAIGTWLVWRTGYRLTGSPGAAWFGWSCLALSAPFFVHAFRASPEVIGATIVMTAVAALVAFECGDARGTPVRPAWGLWHWALVGGALAVLPWLHPWSAGAAGLLGVCLVLRLLGQHGFGRLAAFLTLPLLSAAGWFGYVHAIPQSPAWSAASIARALPALLFDQQFGVLTNAPAYAVALLGLGSLFRVRRRLAVEITLLLISYLLLASASDTGRGGRSALGSFLVPVLPMLGVAAAVSWSRQRSAGKSIALTALGLSALVTVSTAFAWAGQPIFNGRDGVAPWLEWLSPVVDLPRALPIFSYDTTGKALFHTAIWILCIGIGALVIRRAARRLPSSSKESAGGLAMRTLLTLGAVVMVAATATWSSNRVNGASPTTSALALLRGYDPAARPVGVRFVPFGRVSIADVPARLSLPVSSRRPADAKGPLLALFDVPPGVYRLSPATAQAAQGTVVITIGRSPQPVARWTFDPSARGSDFQFTLPVAVNSVLISGDALARRSMPRIALEPVSVAPEVWRFPSPRAARAARYDEVVAFAFEDPGVYVEDNGIWVAGGVPERMAFAGAAGAPVVRFLLRNSPVDNEVTLRGPTRTDVFTMKPGEIRVVELPVNRYNGGALVEVTSARGYRPADVDASTQDRRYLGVWIQNVPR